MLTRWYRELGGLAAFLIVLYAAVSWTNQRKDFEESSDVNASHMSKSRIYSESAMDHADFHNASIHLQDLLAADPHNSHARFQLALCYKNQFVELYSRLYFPRRRPIADPDLVESSKAQLRELGDRAKELFHRCTKSHRYRGRSLFHLAILSGIQRDRESVLQSLDSFFSLNYTTISGIAMSPEFRFLIDDPEFQELIVIEQKLKNR